MPVAAQAFRVLTEFRFEIGGAVASSNQLAGSVDKISNAADQALLSFERLSIGIVASFLSGPGGGVLGVLGTALRVSDDLKLSQIALANVMGKGSGSFADRMKFAEKSMDKIGKLAAGTGISGKALLQFTKTLTPAVRPKLGAENAVNQSAELGRVFLKSAPSLGVDQFTGIQQLRRLILGTQVAGNDLFTVLVQDTDAMRKFSNNAKEFKNLGVAQKMKILTEAFSQFADDSGVIEARFNTMGGQFMILKENLIGVNSIVKKLGNSFTKVVVQGLKEMNFALDGPIRGIVDNLSDGLAPFAQDIETLFASLTQAKSLKGDVSLAGSSLFNTAALLGMKQILDMFGIKIPVITKLLNRFRKVIMGLEAPLFGINTSLSRFATKKLLNNPIVNAMSAMLGGAFLPIFDVGTRFLLFLDKVLIFVSRLLAPLALLVIIFQLLSRAAAHVKIHMAKEILRLGVAFSGVAKTFLKWFALIVEGVDTLSRALATSPIVDFLFWLGGVGIDALDYSTTKLIQATAATQGFAVALQQIIGMMTGDVKHINFAKEDAGAGPLGIFKTLGRAFDFGVEETFSKIYGRIDSGDGALMNQTTNMNVKMENKFKEVLQPDRIAFTIKDQLTKLAQNPRGAAGSGSFKPLTAGGK